MKNFPLRDRIRKAPRRLWSVAMILLLCGLFAGSLQAGARGWVAPELERLGELPQGAHVVEETFHRGESTVRLFGVVFSSRHYGFSVVGNPGGSALDLAEAVREAGGIAGTNGSYFTEELRPLGLVRLDGETRQSVQKGSRLLSGVVLAGDGGLDLLRVAELAGKGLSIYNRSMSGLQGGPFLIDQAALVPGLEATKPARRTVVATDGQRNWALLTLSSCTLADGAAILHETRIFEGRPVRRALNLDGGSSTGIFVQGDNREWNYPPRSRVPNYLILVPR